MQKTRLQTIGVLKIQIYTHTTMGRAQKRDTRDKTHTPICTDTNCVFKTNENIFKMIWKRERKKRHRIQ